MSWRIVKLGDLVENFSVRAKDYGGSEGLDFFGVSNEEGIIKTKYAAEDKAEDYKIIEKGCFAYNPYRVNVGSIGLVTDDFKGLISPAYVVFKPKPNKIIPELLFKFLKSDEGLRQIRFYGRGTVRQALRFEDLCNIELSIPDYSNQEKLFKKLINTQEKTNILSTELTHQLTLVKKLRQQLLQDAVQGKLSSTMISDDLNDDHDLKQKYGKVWNMNGKELLEHKKAEKEKSQKSGKSKKSAVQTIKPEEIPFEIPEGWVWCRGEILASYIDPQPSHRTPPVSTDGVPYIAMSDIRKDGSIDFTAARKVSNITLEEHQNRYKLQDGDFIFGKIGTIGKPVKLPSPFNYTLSANVILIQPERRIINKDYLFYYLSSPAAEKNLMDNKSTMSYPVFGMGKARNMPIPLPPLSEQHRIVQKLDELMQTCDALEASIKESAAQNEKLLQQVLREALRKEEVGKS